MANFNLKSIFTADTKDLKQGAKEAKQAVQDFDDATTSALDQVTGLFGASMKEINTTLSTVRGGFMNFSSALSKSVEGASLFSKAMGVVKVALASTGIGALVVALGSLVAYFTKSQKGANELAVIMGQVKQAFLVVSDAAIAVGRGIIDGFSKTFGFIEDRWKLLKKRMGIKEVAKEEEETNKNVFQRRADLIRNQQKLEEEEIKLIEKRAELETQIAEQRLIADDRTQYSAEQRLAAINKAKKLTDELNTLNKGYAQKQLELMEEEAALSESTNEDYKAIAEKKAEILRIDQQTFTQSKELVTKQAELTALVVKEREERERIEELNARKAKELTLKPIDSSSVTKNVKVSTAITPQIDNSHLKEGVEEAEGYMVDFGKIAADFSANISDAFASMIEGLVSGNFSIQDLFGTILSFLAETLQNIGKALIAYGTAMEAFKNAFKDPWVAIAAGAALVAAGAVLKGLISKMSSGGGNATPAATYAAATVGGGGTLDLRDATSYSQEVKEIKVTGTLKASGNQLVAIIENENKRKSLTT